MTIADYRNFNDIILQGSHISPITIEDLVDISRIIENDNSIKCIVSKEKFVELYFKRSKGNGSIVEAERFYKYFQDDGYATVRSVYFNTNTKQFETQLLKLVFE